MAVEKGYNNGLDLQNVEAGEHWISISDLMAGLMMVFLFISISLMRSAFMERDKIQEVAVAYEQNQVALYRALLDEFEDDLEKWGAKIDRTTLSVEFLSPEVLFDRGKINLKLRFKHILSDFFPRYLGILKNFRDSIQEIRIEGHTSSVWNSSISADEAYFKNMALSQGRTRSVLEYVYQLDQVGNDRPWIKKTIAAVGFSSSHLKLTTDGKEDLEASRRVSFRVITNAETQIRKIIEGKYGKTSSGF